MAGKIFINYRRDDSIGMAGRLHDRLAQTFGRDKLFMDVDHIPAGVDFVEHLNNQVAECDVILVVVGPNWLNVKDDSGNRRLDNPDDFVAIEIAAALARKIRVIPVLVDGARMPKAGELPEFLKPLIRRQAVDVRHAHFGHDAEALVKRMREVFGDGPGIKGSKTLGDEKAPQTSWLALRPRRRMAVVVAATFVLLLLGMVGYAIVGNLVERGVHQAEIKWQEEKAKAAAEAEARRKADEAEQQRLAAIEQERKARAAAEAEKRLREQAEQQRLADLKTEQERQARAAEAARRTQAAAVTPPAMLSPGGIIRLGVGAPMTGPSSFAGVQIKAGAEQAIEDINVAGGILGQKIAASYGDDASDPKQGISVANKFAADDVKFIIGHFNSSVTIASSEVYHQNGMLQITPASTNPRLTERQMWNIFRVCGRDDQQGKVAGEYIVERFKDGKIAIVHDRTIYGKGLADETKKAINKGGVREVLYEGVNAGEKDFSALVSKIKASAATIVYFGGLYQEGGLLVREMRQKNVNAIFMAGDGITTDEFASIGGPAVVGTLMTFNPDARNFPEARTVIERFRAKRFEPEGFTLYSYAAVQIIKQAAEAARSIDPKNVAEKMHSGMNFKTVLGDISFDKKGDTTRLDYVMYLWGKRPDGKIGYGLRQ